MLCCYQSKKHVYNDKLNASEWKNGSDTPTKILQQTQM